MKEVTVGKEKIYAGYKYRVAKDKKTGQVLHCGKIRDIRKMAKLNNWLLFENGQSDILTLGFIGYLVLIAVVVLCMF